MELHAFTADLNLTLCFALISGAGGGERKAALHIHQYLITSCFTYSSVALQP